MKLLLPQAGLIFWTVFFLVTIVLIVYTFIRLLYNDTFPAMVKLQWALVILFVPILGAILYLRTTKSMKHQS